MTIALEVSHLIGICGVDVFALHDRAKQFYVRYGFQPLADDPLHLFLPIESIEPLGISR
jgi:hypothetical protein